MALSLNSSSSGRASAGSLSINHTVANGQNRRMYARISIQDSNHASMPVSTVTFNGAGFTKIIEKEAVGNNRVEIWELADPTVTTAQVVITTDGSVGELAAFIDVYNDADSIEASASNQGSDANPSVAITPLTDNAILLTICSAEDDFVSAGSGQVMKTPLTDQSFENAVASDETKAVHAADTQSFVISTAQSWAIASVALKPKASVSVPVTDTSQSTETISSRKSINYRFYDINGNYKGALTEKDFKGFPEFTNEVNGGMSELRLEAAFSLEDWKYPPDGVLAEASFSPVSPGFSLPTVRTKPGKSYLYNSLRLGYKIKVFIQDKEGERQIYSGIYSGFEIEYAEGGKRNYIHSFIPNSARLSSLIYRNGQSTTIDHASVDPSSIFRSILDSVNSGIGYTDESINDTAVSRTYSFVAQTCFDALNVAINLTPNRWIWFVGGDDLLYLRNIDQHGTVHRIPIEKCLSVKYQKSISFLRNRVLFLGGGSPPLYNQYDASGSQNSWGIYEEKIADERVTDNDTAQSISERFLADKQAGSNFFIVEILDSTFSRFGYDIESIQPGDQIIVSTNELDASYNLWGNFIWGVDYWLYNFYAMGGIPGVVQKKTYKFDSAIFECSFNFDQQNQRIEDIERDLTDYRFKDAPDTPST